MQLVVVPVHVAQFESQKSQLLLLGFSIVISLGQSFRHELLYRKVPLTQLSQRVTSEHVAQGDTQSVQLIGSMESSAYIPDGQLLTHV